jgi:HK97 family phage major capsid protein
VKTKLEKKRNLSVRECSLEIRAESEDKQARVYMSVSSEAPVLTEVRFNGQWMRAYEILDHSDGAIDMSRCKDGLVVQDTHWGDQVGLMRVAIVERKLSGEVAFCAGQRAKDLEQDAINGLRRNVSVGYRVDSSSYRLEGEKDGVPVVRALRWMPYEASFVPIPADTSVGVGREENGNDGEDDVKTGARETNATATREEKIMDPKEMAALFTRAAKHGIDATEVQALVDAGKGRAELDELIVERQDAQIVEMRERKPTPRADKIPNPTPIGGDEKAEQKVMRQYSVMRAIRAQCGDRVDAGLEREVSDELAKQRNKAATGIIIPHAALARRAFTVEGTSSASVATGLQSADFIELLRTKSVLGAAGVRYLTGLVGNVAIPKMTAGATGYWVAEAGPITGSQPTLGQVPGTPHTCGVLTDISRKLLIQSTPDAETLVRDEIIERIIRTIQRAVFAGTGSDGQPSAITTASGINNPSVTAGTPTYAELLNFPGSIMGDNAEADGMKWIMPAAVWAKLAATSVDSGSGRFVLDPIAKQCIGYPYLVTEDVPAKSAWFGNWASVMVGVWGGGLDINVDTATLSSSGGVRIVGLQDVDVMVRNGEALAYNAAVLS